MRYLIRTAVFSAVFLFSLPPIDAATPLAEYDHDKGCSITGGRVYRGKAYPSLAGVYFHGDYCSGRFWGLKHSGGTWVSVEVADTDLSIST